MADEDLIGRTVEHKYAIRSLIGRGGMGVVYEAENLAIGKLVALKVLGRGADPTVLDRFHREARMAGSMGHPNVCEVYDLGQLDDGRPYMVMQRLDGETFRRLMQREAPLEEDVVAVIGAQVFAALAAAHRRGIVHRDIKPENVFLHKPSGDTFVVKVLDFGVAKVVSRASLSDTEAQSLTESGIVLGTPHYMAPEQATGDRVGAEADVFAACIVLYEALSGRKPFDGATHVEVVTSMLTKEAPRLSQVRPQVGAGFDALIASGLARVPADRPTAQWMRQELLSMLPESHAIMVEAAPFHASLAPPSSTGRLDERFRQLAAAFGSFSADFSLAQADGNITSQEASRLRGQLAELERWCHAMREDLGRAASEGEAVTHQKPRT